MNNQLSAQKASKKKHNRGRSLLVILAMFVIIIVGALVFAGNYFVNYAILRPTYTGPSQITDN